MFCDRHEELNDNSEEDVEREFNDNVDVDIQLPILTPASVSSPRQNLTGRSDDDQPDEELQRLITHRSDIDQQVCLLLGC